MNMRERQAMRLQARAHHRDRLAPLVIGRRPSSALRSTRRSAPSRPAHVRVPPPSRGRMPPSSPDRAPPPQPVRSDSRRLRSPSPASRRAVPALARKSPLGRALEHFDFAPIAFDHRELVGQARRDRPRPRHIGAAVLVVSDPRRQRHQPRLELRPLIGPMLARHPQAPSDARLRARHAHD